MLMQKFACPPVGERRRWGVVVRPVVPGEGVILTRIAIDGRVRFAGERRFDFSLRRLGNELVLFGQMHQQRSMKAVDLAQIFLGVAAVIRDRRVDAVARGRQERHQSAEAKAKDSDLAGALGQFGRNVGGVLDVPGAGVPVIGLIEFIMRSPRPRPHRAKSGSLAGLH
jgi:hypothetical protein